MPDQRLEQLKAKYQSVLNLINQLGVQLQNLHVQDNKLFLKGQAKTKADSNKVWDHGHNPTDQVLIFLFLIFDEEGIRCPCSVTCG